MHRGKQTASDGTPLRSTVGDRRTEAAVSGETRVMIEQGRKKRTVASAFDWPGWDRFARTEDDAVAVLAAYRPRYARIADLAGQREAFAAAGDLVVVERLEGIGMTDFYGVSCRSATPEHEQMTEAECDRKIALLRACWTYFDGVASRVSGELRKGPRGGGRDRDLIVRHANGAEIAEFAPKVGVKTDLDARGNEARIRAHRDAFCDAIRDHNARGVTARSWTVQFTIRRSAYHMLDHAWEMEDRDLPAAT
jgi:hypothetical protein